MGIAPSGVHDEAAFVGTNGLGEALRALLEEDVPPTLSAWLRSVDLVAVLVGKSGNGDLALELGLTDLTLDLTAVDSEVAEVRKQLLSTVLRTDKVEKRWRVVDESCPTLTFNEGRVREELDQEGNVGLDTTDAELDQRTKHLSASNLICGTTARALDQHGVIVGSDDSTGKAISSLASASASSLGLAGRASWTYIETNTVAASGTVDLNLTSIRSECLGRVFCGDAALEGEAARRDVVLSQAKLLERCTSGDLDLSCNDVDTSDLLGDCVLDLDTRVDFWLLLADTLHYKQTNEGTIPMK